MNKRYICIVFILLPLLLSMPAYGAQKKKAKPQNRHYVDIHVAAGYTSLLHNTPDARVVGGGGFLLGAGYEFNRKNWILNAGLEFQFHNSTSYMPDMHTSVPYYYTPLTDYIVEYGYDATHIRSTHNTGIITVPLSFGYRFSRYYARAGVALGLGLFGTDHTHADVHINITDPEFAEPMENVGHMTGTSEYSTDSKWRVGFNIAPMAEIGLYLDEWLVRENPKRKHMPPSFRLGLFAQYGAMNIDPNGYIASSVNPLIAGIHFTALISPQKAPKTRTKKPSEPSTKTKTKPAPTPPAPVDTVVIHEDTIEYGEMRIIKEQPVVLENLMFVFGTADIIPESTKTLDQLLSLMLNRSELSIHITGHTDNIGTDAYNQRLSLDRAEAVCLYLTGHGIDKRRITFSGEGAGKPIDTNDTEEGRQRNRRVEITIK